MALYTLYRRWIGYGVHVHLDGGERVLAGEPLRGVGEGEGRVLVVRHRQRDRLLRGAVAEELLLHGQHPVLHQQGPHCPLVLLSSVVNVLTFGTMKIKEG